jgi:hypothetical protein
MMRTIDGGMTRSARAKDRAGSRRRLDEAVGAFGTDSPALLGPMACRITHSARFARCVRTDAASQLLKRAARAAMSPAVLGPCRPRRALRPGRSPGTDSPPDCPCPGSPSDARCRPPARSFAAPTVVGPSNTTTGSRRDRGHPSGAISGSASSAGPGEARTKCALPHLTHGICSSAAPAGRVASYAVLARAEQRSAVGAQRRPTQHEPLAGAPWRDARCSSDA